MSADKEINACDPVQWLDRHGDALYGYCMMRVRDPNTAEDLVQDTLLAALTAAANFKGQSSERTWLVGILKHKIIDHLRKTGREQPLDDTLLPGEDTAYYFDATEHWQISIAEWADPEQALGQEQFRTTLYNCISRLPERLRILYTLRELDDMDTGELIQTLNISSENNLWVMLSRARTHLRLCLETNWFAA